MNTNVPMVLTALLITVVLLAMNAGVALATAHAEKILRDVKGEDR